MTAAAQTRACADCETGDCPCGVTCEGCDYTGKCQTCRGTTVVSGAPIQRVPLGRRPSFPIVHERGTRGPSAPCGGCDRQRRSDSPYYGKTAEQTHEMANEDVSNREKPRCVTCGRPFLGKASRWYRIALHRHKVERWHWAGMGIITRVIVEP